MFTHYCGSPFLLCHGDEFVSVHANTGYGYEKCARLHISGVGGHMRNLFMVIADNLFYAPAVPAGALVPAEGDCDLTKPVPVIDTL